MEPTDLEKRFAGIEARLAFIESLIPKDVVPPGQSAAAAAAQAPPAAPPQSPAPAPRSVRDEGSLVTSLLGWSGAVALVLAASYLIRLAVENGWLTPVRQVAFAAVSGLAMIAAGFVLRSRHGRYAGLLPAGGVAILFLSIYGAHLFYGFLAPGPAALSVIGVCLLSLWLCRAFASDLYALFAVAGSYSAPLLISGVPSVTDLVIYFSAWGVVFSVFAIWQGRRLIYLLALYLALIVFDSIAQNKAPDAWGAALAFQTAQFAIFGAATVAFSIRHRSPLDTGAAWAHLPALLIFYFLQYVLLKRHLPELAPWVAAASGLAVVGLYGLARLALRQPLPGGEFLVWAYAAVVLFHAGYLESVPHAWAPWVAFVAVPVATALLLRRGAQAGVNWPAWVAVAALFAINYLRIVFDVETQSVPGRPWLAIAYAAQLYAAYFLIRARGAGAAELALYAGHVCAMAAALHLLDERILESTAWGVLALTCLAISLWRKDRTLGQSSLLVFAATAAKVMLYDLGGASPVARIVSLVVLGVTFYVGGLLYQRMLVVGEREKAA